MTNDPRRDAAVALHRFGFGPRPGSIAAIASDPRGAVLAELDRPNAGQVANAGLMSSGQINRVAFEFNAERLAKERLEAKRKEAEKQEAAKRAAEGATADAAAMERPMQARPEMAVQATPPETPMLQNFFREARAHFEPAINADIGFAERLVWFWSNHFCVNSDATVMAGAYEREAIRPHVLGKFVDLLLAVEGHPAMLLYLDNTASMGVNSIAGINRSRGLNENFARETLELHTLGVRAGYTQDDVISFANVLTGWTLVPAGGDPERGGEFSFNPRLHEPGAQKVLGKTYDQEGVEQGRAVLGDLAVHPATATHLATKLARHFIADTAPPALVERMAKVFLDTSGDLKEVAKTMITSPESWAQPPGKLKRPSEWVVGIVRACGITESDPKRFTAGQALLGEPLWRPSSPKGYPDDEASWIDGIGRRLDVANNFAERVAATADPQDIIETVFASTVSDDVKQAVGRAESRQQALALLFMSAEFQRR